MTPDAVIDMLSTLVTWVSPGLLVGVLLIPHVINQRKPAVSTIAWVLGLTAFPYIGVLLYITVGESRMQRRVKRRLQATDSLSGGLAEVAGAVKGRRLDDSGLVELPKLSRDLALMARNMGAFAQTKHNEVRVLEGGGSLFPELFAAMRDARRHIHLEYYIFEADETGVEVRELLVEKAKQGVEVRVLWDAVGSLSVARGFFDSLEAVGGKSVSFMPIRLTRRRFEVNFRNHRKIAVIDGSIAFTGGMNIGNEYRGLKTQAWRDVHLSLAGAAVHDLQETFAEDWYFATGENLADKTYFPEQKMPGDEIVQVIGSGPDQRWATIHRLTFAAINMAAERVYIMTPYFVPDESLMVSLTTAAKRGVDVRLLLPARSDQALAFYAGRSYYDELLEAGVRIFEYDAGVLHGKVMCVDRCVAMVGTANMDVRSFFLNFEINIVLYSTLQAARVEALIVEDMTSKSQEVLRSTFQGRPYLMRLTENAARLLSPLL